ncbi:alpha/beta hydrolase [Luteolibacter soli]|uniref:Alpha/beta hydrolase n=1 Tax=Luteolibacter soli TaxID=3135280 RepID=A0ABU9B096_9BACT
MNAIRPFFAALLLLTAAKAETAPERVVYKTIGTRELTLEVDRPAAWTAADKRPAIVFFFGGGWTSGKPEQFQPQAEHFAKRGLVCFRADYRVKSRDGVLPSACVEDALDAMRWVRSHAAEWSIDPGKIIAAGGSAGGHLAACTFLVNGGDAAVSPKPNALLLYNPVVDLTELGSTSDNGLTRGLEEAEARRISPALLDIKTLPPTLVMVGTKDRFHPQIRSFVDKSVAAGAKVEIFEAEGQPHGFFNKAPWQEKTTAQADAFLVRLGYLEKPSEPSAARPDESPSGKRD